MAKTIKIAKEISEIISSRDVSNILKKEIDRTPTYEVQLDFDNVQFVSRSAAHELIELQQLFAERSAPIKVFFINTNPSVANMFRTVAANRVLPIKDTHPQSLPKKISINELAQLV